MNAKNKLPSFLRPLFWSYNFSSIDSERDKKRIIINAINFGKWKHWIWLSEFYGKNVIKKIIEETPKTEFRGPSLKLISLLLGIKKLKYASRNDYLKSQKNISKIR